VYLNRLKALVSKSMGPPRPATRGPR
jgi:hypothetical protein